MDTSVISRPYTAAYLLAPAVPTAHVRLHHPPGNPRHLRRRLVHPLAGLAGRHGRAGTRRQRLRRRGGRRLHAADRRAAPERPRRRSADPAVERTRRPHARAVRPGSGARAGDARLLPWIGRGPGARHRTAARHRARRLRRLADDAARLRHLGTGRRAAPGHRLRPQRFSAGAAHLAGHPGGAGAVPRRVDQFGRRLAARRQGARPRRAAAHAGHRRHLHPHPRRSARGDKRPQWPHRRRAGHLVPRLRRRRDRRLLHP